MSEAYPDYIWQNGAIKPWAEATVHVMAHALHYGSSIFEGIRSYDTPGGTKIFRLTDHLKRLEASAKIYEMVLPYRVAEMTKACRDVLVANSTPATRAFQQATGKIPIVFAQVIDPVASGLVANLARPSGNVTGFTNFEVSMGSKWLELLKEVSPRTTKVALIFNRSVIHAAL